MNKSLQINKIYTNKFLPNLRNIILHVEHIWDTVFRNGASNICRKQPKKKLKWYGLKFSDH